MSTNRKDTDGNPRPATILVVEDDEAVRQAAVWMLQMFGYETREAADGAEAMETLRSDEGIDLLFTDVILPRGMNGIELAEAAQRLRSDLGIVLTTGHAEAETRALNESGFRVLSKPYSNDELAEVLEEILGD